MATNKRIGVELVVTEKGVELFDQAGVKIGNLGETAETTGGKISGASASTVAWGNILADLARRGLDMAIVGMRKLIDVGTESVALSNEQEAATRALEAALATQGMLTAANVDVVQAMADELQRLTGIGDEVSEKLSGVAISMGWTAEQTSRLIPIAADAAAGLQIGLDQAVRQIGKSLGGFAGELGELIPEIKNLTAEQLKAGGALDIIGAKFKGQAAENAKTFGGRIKIISSNISDMKETLGDAIKEGLEKLLPALEGAVEAGQKFVEKYGTDVVVALRAYGTILGTVLEKMTAFSKRMDDLNTKSEGWAVGISKIGKAIAIATGKQDAWNALVVTMTAAVQKSKEGTEEATDAINEKIAADTAEAAELDFLIRETERLEEQRKESTEATREARDAEEEVTAAVKATGETVAASAQMAAEAIQVMVVAARKSVTEIHNEGLERLNSFAQAAQGIVASYRIGGKGGVLDAEEGADYAERLRSGPRSRFGMVESFKQSAAEAAESGNAQALQTLARQALAQAEAIGGRQMQTGPNALAAQELAAEFRWLSQNLLAALSNMQINMDGREVGRTVFERYARNELG